MSSLGRLLLNDSEVGMPPDPGGSADHLDVHEAALLEPDAPAELSRLRTRRFVAGAVRSWASGDGSVVQITLHRFASAADAQFSIEDLRSGLRAAAASEAPFVGGWLLSLPADAPVAHAAHVALSRIGEVVAMVVTVGSLVRGGSWACQLAHRQLERLGPAVPDGPDGPLTAGSRPPET